MYIKDLVKKDMMNLEIWCDNRDLDLSIKPNYPKNEDDDTLFDVQIQEKGLFVSFTEESVILNFPASRPFELTRDHFSVIKIK